MYDGHFGCYRIHLNLLLGHMKYDLLIWISIDYSDDYLLLLAISLGLYKKYYSCLHILDSQECYIQ